MSKKLIKITLSVVFGIACFVFIKRFVSLSYTDSSVKKYSLKQEMNAAFVSNASDKDYYQNIAIKSIPLPVIQEDEILVKVATASFNAQEFLLRKQLSNNQKFIPCSDFSGIVVALGKDSLPFELGDKVFGHVNVALERSGACAEYIKVKVKDVAKKPFSISFKQAAAVPSTLLYMHLMGDLKKLAGKEVIIDDAISENGIMLMQVLRQYEAIVTAIDDKNMEAFASSLGSNKFIALQNWKNESKKYYNKFDIAIDLNGGLKINEMYKLVKNNGLLISSKRKDRYTDNHSKINILYIEEANFYDIMTQVDNVSKISSGDVPIIISKEFYLQQIRDAFTRSEKGNIYGRVLINVAKLD